MLGEKCAEIVDDGDKVDDSGRAFSLSEEVLSYDDGDG